MPIPRPVEDDNPMFLGGLVEQPTQLEILDHTAVAVQQNERLAFAALDIVQLDAIDLEELPFWRIKALGGLRASSINERRDREEQQPRPRLRPRMDDFLNETAAGLRLNRFSPGYPLTS